jgi:hypothetical protein
MHPIAEIAFDLADSDDKMHARLFAPAFDSLMGAWGCVFEIDEPIAVRRTTYGASSLQALVLGLKILSAYLYGSELYEQKKFGLHGDLGGDLSLPAPAVFAETAPYPF